MVNKVHGNISTCATLPSVRVMQGNTLVSVNVNAMRNQILAKSLENQGDATGSPQQQTQASSQQTGFVRRNRN